MADEQQLAEAGHVVGGGKVAVVAPDGTAGTVAAADLERFLADNPGFRPEAGEEYLERLAKERYESTGAQVRAGAEGLARGVTFGGSDYLAKEVGADPRGIEERRTRNPITSTATEIVGVAAPVLLTGGGAAAARGAGGVARAALAASPAAAVGRLGSGAARLAGGGVRGLGAQGVVEGGFLGVGQLVSESALSDDPLTAEHAASVIGSNMLFGGGAGVVAGGAAKLGGALLERGAGAARSLAARKVAGEGLTSVADDLAKLDRAGLRSARQAEVTRLEEAATRTRAGAADDAAAYFKQAKEANSWLATDNAEARKVLSSSRASLRKSLDEPVGLAQNPRKLLDPLRREAKVLQGMVAEGEQTAARFAKEERQLLGELSMELDTLPSAAREVKLTGKLARRYGDFAGRRVRGEITLPLEDAVAYHRALDAGEVTTARQAAIGRQQALLDANLKLQEGIESGYKTVASERLTQIDAAADALASGGKPKLGVVGELAKGGVFGGALAVGSALTGSPWLGAVLAGKVADLAEDVLLRRLAGKLSQGAAAHSERLGAAVERFAKVAERGAQAAPLAATKVLGSVSYASPAAVVATPARAQAVATNERVKVYREREHELLSQVAAGPDGRPTMTPAARRELHGRLAGVAAVSPGLADKLESVAARRIEFLASRLPKRPDAGLAVGPDRWQPSSMDVARFARYVAAVEDPAGVVERLGDGTLTPEDAEALREVYPETFAAVQAQLLDTLPTLRESLPYERRVSLSILLGVPVDPAMQPGVLRILQGNYAAEPGTGGGTAPPRPQLPHGTPKSPEKPTAAQERAG